MGTSVENRPLIFSLSSNSSEEKKEESKEPAHNNVERVRVVVSASFDANDATAWDTDKDQKRTFTNEPKGRCYRADLSSDTYRTGSCDLEAFEKSLQILMQMREPLPLVKQDE